MARTPEGIFLAGAVASKYASREAEKAEKAYKLEGNRNAVGRGIVVTAINEVLTTLTHKLADEVTHAEDTVDMNSLVSMAAEFSDQPTLNNTTVYVAYKVIEEYVNEHTATPQALENFAKEFSITTLSQEEKKLSYEPEFIREGVIFLREDVEDKLTPDALDAANRALQ